MKKMSSLVMTTLLITLASCSSRPTKENPGAAQSPETAKAGPPLQTPSIEAKQLANEEQTSLVTEFAFQKGSDELTPTSKEKLKELTKKAAKRGKIKSVKIISWSDKEYPKNKQALSDRDKQLAKERNVEIRNYLKNLFKDKKYENTRIDEISMAEQPSWFDNLTKTDSSRIKKSLQSAGVPQALTKTKVDAKSGKSIVLILMEQNRE